MSDNILTFVIIFFAVFFALKYHVTKQQNRLYCLRQAAEHNMRRCLAAQNKDWQSEKMYRKNQTFWEKQANSFIPTHPTDEDIENEFRNTDSEIKTLWERFNTIQNGTFYQGSQSVQGS